MLRFIYNVTLYMAMILAAQTVVAQNTLTGTVETTNNEPLTGANIVIENTTVGSASDAAGNYKLEGLKNGNYIVRASFFGYSTVEKPISLTGGNTTLDFEMDQTAIDLDAVVVTGTRTEKSLKNTPILTQSIRIEELQKRDATNIVDALEFVVPGIEFASTATGKSVSLQGISPQYMLFLVDGERLSGETYGDIDYSRINIADIERIEVVKGASSTLYGSNALGGVVNIITKNPTQKFNLAAFSRFSKYNTQNYQLSTGSKLGKVSNQFSVVYDKTDGYDLQEGNSYRTQEREDAVVVNDHLRYTPTEQLVLEGNFSFMNKNRDNTSMDLMDRRNQSFTYGAKGTYFLNTKDNLTLSWNSDNYEILDKLENNELNSVYDNVNNTARVLGNFNLTDWNTLTLGSEYVSENLTASRNDITDATNTDFVMYAQEDLKFGENVGVIGGVRGHNNSEYGWHVTPQMSAMYKIWHFAFRGNYSLGYKTPTLKEKYMNFKLPVPGPPMFLMGNSDLDPETSKYASLSMEYTRKGVSFSVSAYRNDIKDMISENLDEYTMLPGGIIEYSYQNYGKVLLKGIDVLLRSKIVKSLYFNGSATFSKMYDEIEDREFDNVRNFTGKFSLDYNFNHKFYRLDANLQSNFYGAKSINLMDEVTHQLSNVDLESYALWKLTTTHTFKKDYFVRFGIDNVFDFIDESGGYNNGTPGRTFFVGVGINI